MAGNEWVEPVTGLRRVGRGEAGTVEILAQLFTEAVLKHL